jgi:hypothetical protein
MTARGGVGRQEHGNGRFQRVEDLDPGREHVRALGVVLEPVESGVECLHHVRRRPSMRRSPSGRTGTAPPFTGRLSLHGRHGRREW